MNAIVKRITELRKAKMWSQYKLAQETAIPANTVYSWTRIGTMPSLANVEKVCKAMGITLEQFFCGDNQCALSDEESKLLQEWFLLSDIEKKAIFGIIEVFKSLKA